LFFNLLRRELRSRFIGSISGWLWLLVNPLLMLAVYALVFGVIFRARAPADLDVPFVAWLAVAMWPWLGFSDAIQRGSESIPQHAALISKVPIRRELLTLSAAMGAFLLQAAGYVFVLLAVALLGIQLHPEAILVILLVLATFALLASALALVAAALRVFVRDVQHLLPTLLMLWFFATPILYAPELLPDALYDVIRWNPLTGLMGDLRAGLFTGQVVPGLHTWVMLGVSSVLFVLALRFYRRLSPHFEDFL
jgi:ABC-type polysaccharide/polyol phosphate export permease